MAETRTLKIDCEVSPDLSRLLDKVSKLDGDVLRDVVERTLGFVEFPSKLVRLNFDSDTTGAFYGRILLEPSDSFLELAAALAL